jgi:hypothetical protein
MDKDPHPFPPHRYFAWALAAQILLLVVSIALAVTAMNIALGNLFKANPAADFYATCAVITFVPAFGSFIIGTAISAQLTWRHGRLHWYLLPCGIISLLVILGTIPMAVTA